MREALLLVLVTAFIITYDRVLGAVFRGSRQAAVAIERKLCALGLRAEPPDGRTGILLFMGIVLGLPALIVVIGMLSDRSPP